jgi:uncharacterized damage-inducible protein DinB
MKKSHINPSPKYFERYVNLFEDVDLDAAFQESEAEFNAFNWEKCRQTGLKVYAPGKWTIPDVLQHLLDWERIMTYRALGFARGMFQITPGHDENLMAENAGASARSLEEILEEMKTLRASTRQFFNSLNDAQMLQPGVCWEAQMSPLALAFTILGHQRHHFRVLEERYFSL